MDQKGGGTGVEGIELFYASTLPLHEADEMKIQMKADLT
jgi:hypothetical protein